MVAEQPDLLLVHDTLVMVPGEEVVRETRRFCGDAVIGAHVHSSARVRQMLEAGATTVSTAGASPAEVVGRVLDLVQGR